MDLQEKNQRKKIISFSENMESYLAEFHGIKSARRTFKCLNPNHQDKHPSMSINRKNNTVHCFACGKTYNIIDLVKMDQNFETKKEALEWLRDHYGSSQYETKQKINDMEKNVKENKSGMINFINKLDTSYKPNKELIEYLSKVRGFKYAEEISKKFKIVEMDGNIYIPHIHNVEDKKGIVSKTTDFVVRNTNPEADLRYWRSKGTQATYFSIQGDFDLYDKLFENFNIGEKKVCIFLTEGEFDAISYYDLGIDLKKEFKDKALIVTAVASSSVANIPLILNEIKKMPKRVLDNTIFVLSCDHDKAGEDTDLKYQTFFEERHLFYTKSPLFYDAKDINEKIIKNRETTLGMFRQFIPFLKQEYDKQKVKVELARLLDDEIIEENNFTNQTIIPFIHAVAYEIDNKGKPIYNRETLPEKRIFYYDSKKNISDTILQLGNEVRKKYFKVYKPENNVFVYVNSGQYIIPKDHTNNLEKVILNCSQNYVSMDGIEDHFLDENYTVFPRKGDVVSMALTCDQNNTCISKELLLNRKIKKYTEYENIIDDVKAGFLHDAKGNRKFEAIKLEKTSKVLQKIGYEDKTSILLVDDLVKVNENKQISENFLGNLPKLLENPLLVLDSNKYPKNKKNGCLLVLDEHDKNFNNVVIEIIKNIGSEFIKVDVKSDEELIEILKQEKENDGILYVNNKNNMIGKSNFCFVLSEKQKKIFQPIFIKENEHVLDDSRE